MARNISSRPLPVPPTQRQNDFGYPDDHRSDLYAPNSPYHHPQNYPPFPMTGPSNVVSYDQHPTTLRGGTLLHKGFYDLLSYIPTPSPSRLLWGEPKPEAETPLAGPRYEDIRPAYTSPPAIPPPPISSSQSPDSSRKQYKRISKDMVSKPTGFV